MINNFQFQVIDFRLRFRTNQMLKPWNPNNPAPHFKEYIKLYKMKPRLSIIPMNDFIKNMQSKNVDKGVVCGGSIEDNLHIDSIMKTENGAYFYPIIGVNPKYGINRNIKEIIKYHKKGFLGVNLSPYIWGIKANAKELFPIYAICEQFGIIAIIHGSIHYNRGQSMWLGDPKHIDDIAIHFPKLKIVISHASNGFGVLGLAVAQRHPNIYLEFSALRPKYLPEITISAINTYLKNRCLFGTDYPLIDFNSSFNEWNTILRDDVKELFFNKNAIKCLFKKGK